MKLNASGDLKPYSSGVASYGNRLPDNGRILYTTLDQVPNMWKACPKPNGCLRGVCVCAHIEGRSLCSDMLPRALCRGHVETVHVQLIRSTGVGASRVYPTKHGFARQPTRERTSRLRQRVRILPFCYPFPLAVRLCSSPFGK